MMLGQHMRHAFARAFAPQRDQRALAGGLQLVDVRGNCLEHIGVRRRALGGKIAPGVRADLDHMGGFRCGKGREPRQRGIVEAFAPFRFGKIEPVRRQRLVGRPSSGLILGILARLVVIGDLHQPFVRGFVGQRLERKRRCRQVIEQCFQPRLEQRQPMLHAAVAAAFADGFIQNIVGRGGAERRHVAGAE